VTIIAHPEPTRTAPAYVLPSIDVVFETLALAKVEGLSLETAMLAALISARSGLSPLEAVDAAMYGEDRELIRAAGDQRERLLEQARRVWLAAEYSETPEAVTG
jgi:hypothetical protein